MLAKRSILTVLAVVSVLALGGAAAFALAGSSDSTRAAAPRAQYTTDTTPTTVTAATVPTVPSVPSVPSVPTVSVQGTVTEDSTVPSGTNEPSSTPGKRPVPAVKNTDGGTPGTAKPASASGSGNACHVALLFVSTPDPDVLAAMKAAAGLAGQQVSWWGVLREPIDVSALASHAAGSGFAGLTASGLKPFAREMGHQIMDPQALIRAERDSLLSEFHSVDPGSAAIDGLEPLCALEVAHDQKPKLTGDEAAQRRAVFAGLFRGLRDTKLPVVSVEFTNVSKTTVPFFKHYKIKSTVDNLDTPTGVRAVALLLQGAKPGHYGVKKGALSKLPSTAPVSVGG